MFTAFMKARRFAPGVVVVLGLWAGSGQPILASDAALYGLFKSQQFHQTNAAAPVAQASNGFAFTAFVFANGNHLVTNATVKPSNSTPLRPLTSDANQAAWLFEERFGTQVELNNVYPNGTVFSPATYAFTLRTVHDGTKTPSLSMGGASVVGTPPTLQVTNFTAAQSINPAAAFALQWNAAGGQSSDIIQVRVLDSGSNTVFVSPAPLSPGALTGQSNSVVIPASTLLPLTQYTANLFIARPVGLEVNAYPGATGLPALVKDVEFPLATRTAPGRPRLEVLSTNGSPFRLRFIGEPNLTYHIQISDNLTAWETQFSTNSATGTGSYTDLSSVEAQRRYYRILVGQ